jgi:hypothetical protein
MKRALTGIVLGVAFCAAIALTGCTRARQSSNDYFPMKAGMAWTFRFSGSNGASGELTTANLTRRKLFGYNTVPQKNFGGDKSYTEFYADDGSGIRHVAIDEGNGLESRLGDHSYVIKWPIHPGTSWRELDRTADNIIYDATTRIEAVAESISVPAGKFSGCIRVHSTGLASTMKGTARAPHGRPGVYLVAADEVSVEDYYWLAPGVGPVKATHQETHGVGPTTESMSYTLELEQLKH